MAGQLTDQDLADLLAVYQDLHRHPELSFAEHRTSASVADRLTSFGCVQGSRRDTLLLVRNAVGRLPTCGGAGRGRSSHDRGRSLRAISAAASGPGSACRSLAAATVLRLQTIASREIAGTDTAILTVGAIRAGTKENIVLDDAELLLSLRTFDPSVRNRVLESINRIVHGEAATSGASREPEVELTASFPAVVNDPVAAERTRSAFAELLGADRVIDPGVVTGSEDVGLLATAAEAPCVF
jgi:metal-dependent amidase/aminoacylase/carboxypeptidase family protein